MAGTRLPHGVTPQAPRLAALFMYAASAGLGLAACLWPSPTLAAACTGSGVEVQVLGSGGPESQARRASSSYLVWRDGKARVLVDAGGGSFVRFGQAGAQMKDLDLVLFTHFHADHSADFGALVKSSFFEERERALPVLGPPGNARFPGAAEFVRALFDAKRGAFRYLGDFLTDGRASYTIKARDIKAGEGEVQKIDAAPGLVVHASKVTHGPVPAIAWRVESGGVSVVFGGDTNGDDGVLEKLARGADLFVAHNAVPEGAAGVERFLHMPPSVIGRIAAAGSVKRVVLSHRMQRTLGKEPETLKSVSAHYAGPVSFADDLDCFPVMPKP